MPNCEVIKTRRSGHQGSPEWGVRIAGHGMHYYFSSRATRDALVPLFETGFAGRSRGWAWGDSLRPLLVGREEVDYLYRLTNPTHEDETEPTTTTTPVDYKAKYEQLVRDLRDEAQARNFCSEFDRFAEKAGIPAELIQQTVRITYEFKVPRNIGIRTAGQAHRTLTSTTRAAELVQSFEVL